VRKSLPHGHRLPSPITESFVRDESCTLDAGLHFIYECSRWLSGHGIARIASGFKKQIPKLSGLSGTASDQLKDFVTAAPIPGSYLSNSHRIAEHTFDWGFLLCQLPRA